MNHAEARKIVQQAWQSVHGRAPSANELLYTQAIALLETGYGRAGQFGQLAANGQYNWGALERRRNADGSCPPGTAAGSDQGAVCFYVFPDDISAAAAFIKNLTARHWPTIQAMKGTAEDVARAMRVPPAYYAGYSGSENDRVQAYANAIKNGIQSIGQHIPGRVKSGFPWFLFGLAGIATAYWYGHRNGFPSWVPKVLRY